jgi:hypothetical protein
MHRHEIGRTCERTSRRGRSRLLYPLEDNDSPPVDSVTLSGPCLRPSGNARAAAATGLTAPTGGALSGRDGSFERTPGCAAAHGRVAGPRAAPRGGEGGIAFSDEWRLPFGGRFPGAGAGFAAAGPAVLVGKPSLQRQGFVSAAGREASSRREARCTAKGAGPSGAEAIRTARSYGLQTAAGSLPSSAAMMPRLAGGLTGEVTAVPRPG